MRVWTGEEFLTLLNRHVVVRGSEIVPLISTRTMVGQEPPRPADAGPELGFTHEIDMVIEGPCSGFAEPMSEQLVAGALRYIEQAIGEKKPKGILLISSCCGSYHRDFQHQVRALGRGVMWDIPVVGDFGDLLFDGGNPHLQQSLAGSLLRQNIVQVAVS